MECSWNWNVVFLYYPSVKCRRKSSTFNGSNHLFVESLSPPCLRKESFSSRDFDVSRGDDSMRWLEDATGIFLFKIKRTMTKSLVVVLQRKDSVSLCTCTRAWCRGMKGFEIFQRSQWEENFWRTFRSFALSHPCKQSKEISCLSVSIADLPVPSHNF